MYNIKICYIKIPLIDLELSPIKCINLKNTKA